MKPNLLIIGAGGHGRVVREIAEESNLYERISFLDDNAQEAIDTISNLDKYTAEFSHAFIAIGNNETREKLFSKAKELGYKIPNIAHTSSVITKSAILGNGIYIGANAVINSNSVVENGVILGVASIVEHDAKVEKFYYMKAGSITKTGSTLTQKELLPERNVL